MQPSSLVVVAFKPFTGRPVNRALQLAQLALKSGKLPPGTQIVPCAVTRGAVDAVVRQALPASKQVPVIWLGETDDAASRGALLVETIAQNSLHGQPIDTSNPRGHRTVVLHGSVAAQLCPTCDVSRDAGDHLCNYAMCAMHANSGVKRWVFLHVPRHGDSSRQLEALSEVATGMTGQRNK